MGIEPFLVATSVHLVVAQRLTRRVCQYCKELVDVPDAALLAAGFAKEELGSLQIFKGRGCDRCNDTGCKGRVGLYEAMPVDDEIRELILSGASPIELRQQAVQNGMLTLRGSGLQKIRNGVTTLEEVLRETVL